MRRAVRRSKQRERRIARERIVWLLTLADAVAPERPDLAKRYGELARRISLRARVRIPRRWRWRYCRECKSYLIPGVNAAVRTRPRRMPHLVIRCLECGAITRRPYLREKRRKLRFKMPAEGRPE
ncbi:MAG: ribonuclease P [Candidatus Korarchaeota archaeon]|nr:ribonuclease P [Candidatus Korarchaeota archaeon]